MTSLSKDLSLSSSLNKEVMNANRLGIVSILGSESDNERTKATASLKRTLSADMSSMKWQTQHGFIPLKRIASSDELLPSSLRSSSSGFWRSLNDGDNKGGDHDKMVAGQLDIWSSIVAQKTKDDEQFPAPYVHPLVKRSASSLSGKSLEICTESLGSESGSDGYSYDSSSEESSDQEEDDVKEDVRVEESKVGEKLMVPLVTKINNLPAPGRRVQPRSFPPLIPSLGSSDGSCVRMKSHRNNGRVVLEAVSVPSRNNFRAERQDGRLVLSFIDASTTVEGGELTGKKEIEQFEVEMGDQHKEDMQGDGEEGVEDDKKVGFVVELDSPRLPSGVIMHKMALMMSKQRVLAYNINPNLSTDFDDTMETEKKKEEMLLVAEQTSQMTQSLPPRPPIGQRMITATKATVGAAPPKATGSLNAYEYYWKAKSAAPTRAAPRVATFDMTAKPSMFQMDDNKNNNLEVSKSYMANERQDMMLLRGNNIDCLVPSVKGCKDPRRSFSLREPHCIATS